MSDKQFEEKAIQLISVTEDNQLKLNQEGVDMLNKIPKPLAVVGVAGQYRTGKSFLLNRVILDLNNGFPVGSTTNACTKGIWMWGSPLRGQTKDGRLINVVVLDSEGLGAIDEHTSHDSRIFSLVMLLSSCFIFNSIGSIDENALDNLSLIVDLTKHIQIKLSGNDDVDYEDFSFYMPSFLWVVRDFSLELIRNDGLKLTPKEYLEHALIEAKGFSEQVETKNKIRRLLATFFKERDCYTLVRPVLDEEQLRKIDTLPQSSLRPEFLDEMLILRDAILKKSKAKQLESEELSGSMLAQLAQNYLTAFNEKKIPVIETCWNYICKAQCQKAMDQSIILYEKEMESAFQAMWPVGKQALKNLHKETVDVAIKEFHNLAVGDQQDDFLIELKEELYKKYLMIKSENAIAFEENFKNMMHQTYAENIEPLLQEHKYKNFVDYDRDLTSFRNYFQTELELNGPNKQLLLLEFLQHKLQEGTYQIVSTVESSCDEQVRLLKGQRDLLEEQFKNAQEDLEKHKRKTEITNSDLKDTNEKLERRFKQVDDLLKKNQQEREAEQNKYMAQINKLQTELQQQSGTLNEDFTKLQQTNKELEKKIMLQQSQFDEKLELMKQQVQFHEQRLQTALATQENKEREIDNLNILTSAKVSEATEQIQKLLNERNQELDILHERLQDKDDLFSKQLQDYQLQVKQMLTKEQNQQALIQQLQDKFDKQSQYLKKIQNDQKQEIGYKKPSQEIKKLEEQIGQLKQELNEKTDRVRQVEIQNQSEKARLKQTNEFLENKTKDLQRQLNKAKQLYEETMATMETATSNEQHDINKQILEINQKHDEQMMELQHILDNTKQDLQLQIETLLEEKEAMQAQLKDIQNNNQNDLDRLKDSLSQALIKTKDLQQECQNLEQQKQQLEESTQNELQNIIQNYDKKVKELESKKHNESENIRISQEEELKNITEFYQQEKEKQELQYQEDREKLEYKIQQIRQEYEERMHQEADSHDEDIESLKSELANMKIQCNSYIQTLQQEVQKKTELNDQLQNQLSSVTEKFENLKKQFDDKIKFIKDDCDKDIKDILNQSDAIRQQLSNKETQLWEASQNLQQTNLELIRVQEALSMHQKQNETEIQRLKTDAQEAKARAEQSDHLLFQQKLDYDKKIALADQNKSFLSHRIEELLKQQEDSQSKLEQKTSLIKNELSKDMKELEQKYKDQITQWQQKYESRRKMNKENEQAQNLKIKQLEQEKQQIQEQLQEQIRDFQKKEHEYQNDNSTTKRALEDQIKNYQITEKERIAQVEELRKENQQLHIKFTDIEANYDTDKELWSSKFTFQEDQKEMLIKERDDAQRNFDLMMQQLQKMRNQDKEDLHSTQTSIIQSLESKHNLQQNEQNEKHRNIVQGFNEKISKLSKECNNLHDVLFKETKTSNEKISYLESCIRDRDNIISTLKDQIQKMKSDKDTPGNLTQKQLQNENEMLQKKIQELEKNCNELSAFRKQARFELEKEKVRLNTELDNYKRMKNELYDRNRELEREKEYLIKDNEKLKTENKKYKLLGIDNVPKMPWKSNNQNTSRITDVSGNDKSEKSFNPPASKVRKMQFGDYNNFDYKSEKGFNDDQRK